LIASRNSFAAELESSPFAMPAVWLPRLQLVRHDLEPTLLDAEYCFSVTIGNLKDTDDGSAFESTGLRWPSKG
jgi:hypothetical protein